MPFSLTLSTPCYDAAQPSQDSPSFGISLCSSLKRGCNFLPAYFLGITYLMSRYYMLGFMPGSHTCFKRRVTMIITELPRASRSAQRFSSSSITSSSSAG